MIDKYNILFNTSLVLEKSILLILLFLKRLTFLKPQLTTISLHAGSIFLDFSEAFDTVNHEILLRKLHKYGVRGKADLDWFTTFLANRTQYVKLGNVESNFLRVFVEFLRDQPLGKVKSAYGPMWPTRSELIPVSVA